LNKYTKPHNLYVDKLCLRVLIIFIVKKKLNTIICLQRRRKKFLDLLYSKILIIFGLNVHFEKITNTDKRYKNVFDCIEVFLDSIKQDKEIYLKTPLLCELDKQLCNYRFKKIWRLIVIHQYLQDKKAELPIEFICGMALNQKILDKLTTFLNIKYKSVNTHLFTSYAVADESEYLYQNDDGCVKRIKQLCYIVFFLIIPRRVSLRTQEEVDILFFSHDNSVYNETFNPTKFSQNIKEKILLVTPNLKLKELKDYNPVGFLSISIFSLARYFWLMSKKANLIFGIAQDSCEYFKGFKFLSDYCFNLIIIEERKVKVVYSLYESSFTQAVLLAAKVHKKTISISGVWSLGYFPSQLISTFNKCCDRYFIWGEWHHYIMSKSGDNSDAYIMTGYPGLEYSKDFKNKVKKLRSSLLERYANIITYYDTSIAEDLFLSEQRSIIILDKLINLARNSNSVLIFKTKKNISKRSLILINSYSKHIVLDFKQSNLIPAFASDLCIGVLNSTLVAVSEAYGKNCCFINMDNIIDDKWIDISTNNSNIFDINKIVNINHIDDLLSSEIKSGISKKTDYFSDGNCARRISDYFNYLQVSQKLFNNKTNVLLNADNLFTEKYGIDSIII